MTEGSTAWHGLVFAKRVEWTAKAGDVEDVAEDDDLAIEANLGGSNAKDWKTSVIAQRDKAAISFGVTCEGFVIVEHEVCCTRVGTCFFVVSYELENRIG